MVQKRFTFEDENETVQTKQPLSQIDQYENYKHAKQSIIDDKNEINSKISEDAFPLQHPTQSSKEESIPTVIKKETKSTQKKQTEGHSYNKKPKQKVKKKTKRKTKNKTKVVREKGHRSWFSTLILFLISLCIIAGICIGGYVAYQYYLKQQEQINNLQEQLQDQQKPSSQEPSIPPVEDTPSNSNEQNSNQENQPTETPNSPSQGATEDNTNTPTE